MRFVVALIALAAILAIPHCAKAQQPPPCRGRADLLSHLAKEYKEAPAVAGLTDNGMMLEVYASKDGETWTAVVTSPQGVSCLIATGHDWTQFAFVLPDPDQPL